MKKWSAEELTFLRESYGSVSAGYIADRLGRSLNAIYIMADKINVSQKNWSKEEGSLARRQASKAGGCR
jgi:hypothetical protein